MPITIVVHGGVSRIPPDQEEAPSHTACAFRIAEMEAPAVFSKKQG